MRAWVITFAVLTICAPAAAHDSRPLFIELSEAADGVDLSSTAPASIDLENAPVVALAAPCIEMRRERANALRQRAHYRCAIADAEVTIDWPSYNPSLSALIRATYADGETRTAMIEPSATRWRAPAPEDFAGVSKSYFKIGVEHILGGIDHLLFLAGLLYISGTLKRTLVTITGFTLSHSLTLALVALGLIRVSVPATEAVIALSIVFLATEIARGDRTTIAWRRPLVVASAFGLVHGAGFAAALSEIGLPKTETIAALLFFNVGVEAGQLGVVLLAFTVMALARNAPTGRLTIAHPDKLAGYGLGIISAYWFVQRLAVLVSA